MGKAKEPAIRVDGKKRVDLKKLATRRRERRDRPRPPVEDDRVSQAWARQARRDVAKANGAKEVKAMREELERPRYELQTKVLDNPYFAPDHPISRTNPKKAAVAVNIRESAVATLAARGLLDEAQVEAADKFRRLWETMGGKGAGAMDYTQQSVDGGAARDPIGERQINAGKELRDARHLVGARGFELIEKVCGQGFALAEVAPFRRHRDTAADNLRAHLEDLALMWGFQQKKATQGA